MRIHDACRLEVTTLICLSYKGETERGETRREEGGQRGQSRECAKRVCKHEEYARGSTAVWPGPARQHVYQAGSLHAAHPLFGAGPVL